MALGGDCRLPLLQPTSHCKKLPVYGLYAVISTRVPAHIPVRDGLLGAATCSTTVAHFIRDSNGLAGSECSCVRAGAQAGLEAD